MNPYVTGKKPPFGQVPAVMLTNPKYAYNVSMALRIMSCYGHKQLWFTGDRVTLDLEGKRRLPREERMKGYRDVELVQWDKPLEMFAPDVVPVAVEVRPNSERLDQFVHPKKAIYVFGPEDGSIPQPVLAACHRFVVIPLRHCLNLACAVQTVMWDRAVKLGETVDPQDARAYVDTDPQGMGVYDELSAGRG